MRVAICDDNKNDLARYSGLVREIAGLLHLSVDIAVYENAKHLLFDLDDAKLSPDVLLIDINMPMISGVDAARHLRGKGYKGELVFFTISTDYMLTAFDLHAYNYIVKNQTPDEKTARIVREVLKLADEKKTEYMLFTGVGEYRNIAISDIKYFEVRGKIVTVYYGNTSFEFVSTIGKVENMLFTKGFVRVHKSFLVSGNKVKTFNSKDVTMWDGTLIPVGRKYYAQMKEWFVNRS